MGLKITYGIITEKLGKLPATATILATAKQTVGALATLNEDDGFPKGYVSAETLDDLYAELGITSSAPLLVHVAPDDCPEGYYIKAVEFVPDLDGDGSFGTEEELYAALLKADFTFENLAMLRGVIGESYNEKLTVVEAGTALAKILIQCQLMGIQGCEMILPEEHIGLLGKWAIRIMESNYRNEYSPEEVEEPAF
jgi:hypothetical protein